MVGQGQPTEPFTCNLERRPLQVGQVLHHRQVATTHSNFFTEPLACAATVLTEAPSLPSVPLALAGEIDRHPGTQGQGGVRNTIT